MIYIIALCWFVTVNLSHNINTMKKYTLNTGGNCIITVTTTNKKDKQNRMIVKVRDNFTGFTPKEIECTLTKYSQSFRYHGIIFYMSEFTEQTN